MAQVTNTSSVYDSVGQREDLEDVIYNTSPQDTPFVSAIKSQRVKAVKHEWQTDTFAAPGDNAVPKGDEYTYDDRDESVRVGNFTQISRKTLVVEETLEAVDKAGRESEVAMQLMKMGVELRKDQEYAFLANQASVAGNKTTAARCAGLPAWLTSNVDRGSGGSNGGWNSGTGLVDAANDGTLRAFSKTLFDTVIQKGFQNGANFKMAMVSPYNKRVFSTFMSDTNVAQLRYAATKGKNVIAAAADIYLSDFGEISVEPNRVMAEGNNAALARNVFLIDPSMAARGVLRPVKVDSPARTGDATKKVLITEYTLIVKNEMGHGVIADVYGLTSST